MNVLFIVYYLDPSISVGAHRISYWANNLSRVRSDVSVEVITAVPNKIDLPGVKRVHVVPPPKTGSFIIADEGFTWKPALRNYVQQMDFDFDWVIMSGGPFMYFGIANQLKQDYGTRVLLDFRDPFARNPRFNNSFLKVAIKSYFENKFIRAADQIVTVNEQCVELLKHQGIEDDKYSIIQNGYDEMILDTVSTTKSPGSTVKMVYCGTFFDDRNPTNMLRLIGKDEYNDTFEFTHIGRESAYVSGYKEQENVHAPGMLSYPDMLQFTARADIGLIFTSGSVFESTTKIFDYIGLEKAILIVTEGEVRTGNLHAITEQYPLVYWSKNDEVALGEVLNKIRNADLTVSFSKKEDFSRMAGLKKLATLINID
ncbi:MAG: glycosyltransferase [Flavobacteriales bacterium]|nr:glycosyltransferase [Flavobacteriales bacterium]